jgi:hypothetical protein
MQQQAMGGGAGGGNPFAALGGGGGASAQPPEARFASQLQQVSGLLPCRTLNPYVDCCCESNEGELSLWVVFSGHSCKRWGSRTSRPICKRWWPPAGTSTPLWSACSAVCRGVRSLKRTRVSVL